MTNDPSSPVCYAAQADDAYMGYAPRDELLAALNELLEAERAGAKVALASSKPETNGAYTNLMQRVRADEARWCAMLTCQIGRLGGLPSDETGAFHQKALAIADPLDRLIFLNRGQAWVVRRLEALLRRVRDDDLHRHLKDMLESHRANIEATASYLAIANNPT
ncbi:hypothetical protein KRR38_31220 [Novosphingobium sp. G106]|uniref:DUF6306 domain-containing protein n=1 Tax=Novosphingobium sp. G106 TaxID=2849500 RepID=UPI001C2D0FD8|nr:DUF6306 domain-containing protein [Novosphingobium sp. G106]MBV1692019.1 hypothetical protein [Novosphingobium sp. G106]